MWEKISTALPSVKKAWVTRENRVIVQRCWLRDHSNYPSEKKKKGADVLIRRNSTDEYSCDLENGLSKLNSFPTVYPAKTKLIVPSICGKYVFVAVESADPKVKGCTIEIWNDNGLFYKIATKTKIYSDDWLGNVSWSQDSKYLVFVAESEYRMDDEIEDDDMEKFAYQETWGEGYSGSSRPRPFILNVQQGVVNEVKVRIKEEGKSLTIGQPIWTPNGKGLVATCWEVNSRNRKLGLIYCSQRKSRLVHLDVSSIIEDCESSNHTNDDEDLFCDMFYVTGQTYISRSPRFSPSGGHLIFLSSPFVKTHGLCAELRLLDWTSFVKQNSTMKTMEKIVVPVVDAPKSPSDFPGLFCLNLPNQCFSSDGSKVLLTTKWGSHLAAVSVHLDSGKINRIGPRNTQELCDTYGSSTVLASCVEGNMAILGLSSPLQRTKIVVVSTDSSSSNPKSCFDNKINEENEDVLNGCRWKIVRTKPKNCDGLIESILILPSNEGVKQLADRIGMKESLKENLLPPLIAYPHGGPHGAWSSNWMPHTAMLVASGFGVILINYRGSTGFGASEIANLPGKVGSQDVNDCVKAIESTLELKVVDVKKMGLFVVGGSHGGFLGAHLIGQKQPFDFTAAVLRNPVCNIANMVGVSDIPDWCYVEAGIEYNFEGYTRPTSDVLDKMLKVSPISYVSDVKAPLMLCLGGKDKRVPPCTGLEFMHCLRAQGNTCKLLFFPDESHPLSGDFCRKNMWPNIVRFLQRYMPNSRESD
eukprot:g2397.t1